MAKKFLPLNILVGYFSCKTAVMGFVEREGKGRLTAIGDNTFKDLVRKNVKKDAIVITDQHNEYKG